MSDPSLWPAEPGVYVSESMTEPFTLDTLHTEIERLKEQNVPEMVDTLCNEILILRDYLRDADNPHVDPANEYCYIGDRHVDVRIERSLQWWNDYWSKKTGVPTAWGSHLVPMGRYRVYQIDEEWIYCRWESPLPHE